MNTKLIALALKEITTRLEADFNQNQESKKGLAKLERNERAWIHQLVSSSLKNNKLLNQIIENCWKKKPKKISKDLNNFLILATCHLQFSHKKDYAIVSQFVEATNKVRLNKSKGLINFNLREQIRKKEEIKKLKKAFKAENILPEWMKKEFLKNLAPDEIRLYCEKVQSEAGTYIFSPFYSQDELEKVFSNNKIQIEQTETSSYYKLIFNKESKPISEVIEYGYIIDPSSLFVTDPVAKYFSDKKSLKILDACAAPGGKSISLLRFLNKFDQIDLTLNDLSSQRIELINENLSRIFKGSKLKKNHFAWNIQNCDLSIEADLNKLEKYDLLLLDLPCSSTGVLKRTPQIAINTKQNDLEKINKLQKLIIKNTKKLLKPDGLCILSVCSLAGKESTELVDFAVKEIGYQVDEELLELYSKDFKRKKQGVYFIAENYEGDGFFVTALRPQT